jgi:immune inhibitor A
MNSANGHLNRLVLLLIPLLLLSGACRGRAAGTDTSPQQTTPATSAAATSAGAAGEKLGLHATGSTGDQEYLVILVDFPGQKRVYPVEATSQRMGELLGMYFQDASYGKLRLTGDVIGPYVMPHPVGDYRISARNLEVDPQRLTALVTDAVNAADKDVDLGKYDYILIGLGAQQSDYGMIGLCALPGMLAFRSGVVFKSPSGKTIDNVALFCENAHMGTFIHDTIHMIGGFVGNQRLTPCLYDHDLQMLYPTGDDAFKTLVNMGFWDPLSSHFPYDRSLPPAGLSSWTKLRLNWIDASQIALVHSGETTTITLDPLSSHDAQTLVIRIPVTDCTYYLVENRQAVSSDANCPTTGVLILYADDTVLECRNGQAPVRIMDANPSVPFMNDATYDIGKVDRFVDSEHGIAISLEGKEGLSYRIRVASGV